MASSLESPVADPIVSTKGGLFGKHVHSAYQQEHQRRVGLHIAKKSLLPSKQALELLSMKVEADETYHHGHPLA